MTSKQQSGYDCEFVEKPPKPFQSECPVCLLVLREPFQATCCGYSFCRVCIERIKANHKLCPCCKQPNFLDFPNKGLQRSLSEFKVCCTNHKKGCRWVGELGELDNHLNLGQALTLEQQLKGCPYVEVACLHCFKVEKRSDIQVHLRDRCHKRPFSCQYCRDYDSDYEDVTTNHWPVCGYYPVLCSNECGKVLQRQNLERHLSNDCPLTLVNCDFKHVGCEVRLSHKDMPAHLTESIGIHLSLQAASYKQLVTRLEKENEKLKCDNKLLHQKLDEQQQQIAKLTEDLQAFSISTPLAPVEFTMLEFDAWQREGVSWFSSPFYTHTEGYKMYLEIDANGFNDGEGTYISMYVSLMRGEFDDQLVWPFQGEITIHLLSQVGDEEHYTDILTFDHDTPNKYTSRVTESEYPEDVYGFDMFCSHNDLRPKYLINDCLKVRIEVVTYV